MAFIYKEDTAIVVIETMIGFEIWKTTLNYPPKMVPEKDLLELYLYELKDEQAEFNKNKQ